MAALRARGAPVSPAQGRARLHRPHLPRRRLRGARAAATSTPGWSATSWWRRCSATGRTGPTWLSSRGSWACSTGWPAGATWPAPPMSRGSWTRRWCWSSTPPDLRSVAATVHGFASWDRRVRLAGVVLNRVASERHETLLRAALAPTGIPVLGALPREATLHTPSRHLGLVPASERPGPVAGWLPGLRELVARGVDLDGLMAVARAAPRLTAERWSPATEPPAARRGVPARIAVAAGRAFTRLRRARRAAGRGRRRGRHLRPADRLSGCPRAPTPSSSVAASSSTSTSSPATRRCGGRSGAVGGRMPVVAECAGSVAGRLARRTRPVGSCRPGPA